MECKDSLISLHGLSTSIEKVYQHPRYKASAPDTSVGIGRGCKAVILADRYYLRRVVGAAGAPEVAAGAKASVIGCPMQPEGYCVFKRAASVAAISVIYVSR